MGCPHIPEMFQNGDDRNGRDRDEADREREREERHRQRRRAFLRRRIHMVINAFLDYVANHVNREVLNELSNEFPS